MITCLLPHSSTPVPYHRIQRRHHFSDTGSQRHLLVLAGRDQALVVGPDNRVVLNGGQRRHVQNGPHAGPAAPDPPFALQFAAVPVIGRHAGEGGDLLVAEPAQLRQVAQESIDHDLPDPRHGQHDGSFRLPALFLLDQVIQQPVQLLQLPLQVEDMAPDIGLQEPGHDLDTVLLHGGQFQQLAPARQQVPDFHDAPGLMGPHRWADHRRKFSDQAGIDFIGLGQLIGGLGVAARVQGLADNEGQAPFDGGLDQGVFVPAGGFHHDAFEPIPAQAAEGLFDPGRSIVHGKIHAPFVDADIQLGLADIHAHVDAVFRLFGDCFHNSPLLDSGSWPLRLFEFRKTSRCDAARLLTGSAQLAPSLHRAATPITGCPRLGAILYQSGGRGWASTNHTMNSSWTAKSGGSLVKSVMRQN